MDWIGNFFIIVGLYMAGNKERHAFLFSLVGESLWIVWSAMAGLYSLTLICVVFAVLAAVNWVKWGRDEAKRIAELQNRAAAEKAMKKVVRRATLSPKVYDGELVRMMAVRDEDLDTLKHYFRIDN